MWAAVIAAPETFLRLAGFNLCGKNRHLLLQFGAAAVGALALAFIAGVFQQLGCLAAVIAFIFVYRHFTP
jgi:hypothetical protein